MRRLWYLTNALFLLNPLNPSSTLKVMVLRLFGARVGKGVMLKPGINVKYPWHLVLGDHVWIGEGVWLDNLAPITIGSHSCVSQGAYLGTGNHDWRDPAFGLIVKPITLGNGVWVGARVILLPGVTIGTHAVVTAGAVISMDAEPYMIYKGNPAVAVKARTIGGIDP